MPSSDRYGIETACLRIGSSFPEPRDRRMLITWLSYRDLTELVRCCLFAARLGHTVVYGMSDNRDKWWDNSKAAHIGFRPQDSSEPFRARLEALPPWIRRNPLRSTRAALSSRPGRSRRTDERRTVTIVMIMMVNLGIGLITHRWARRFSSAAQWHG